MLDLISKYNGLQHSEDKCIHASLYSSKKYKRLKKDSTAHPPLSEETLDLIMDQIGSQQVSIQSVVHMLTSNIKNKVIRD